MTCPACSSALMELNAGEIVVDLCRNGCGGVWFDNREIRKVDEPSEEGDVILAVQEEDGFREVDAAKRRNCPKCEGVVMMRHFYSAFKTVEIDCCPGCGGHWLDRGELAKIRAEMGEHAVLVPGQDEPRAARPQVPEEVHLEHLEDVEEAGFLGRLSKLFSARRRGGF